MLEKNHSIQRGNEKMLNHLNNHFNKTETTNGALAFKSTQSAVLDMFAQGGAMRQSNDRDVVSTFSKAFAEELALKALFYLRDIRGAGQGERRFFKLALVHLANHHKASLKKNLHLIPEFGRWDDLLVLLDTPLKSAVVLTIMEQLAKDMKGVPSLLGKWLPSENASSKETKRLARLLTKELGMKPAEYRKMLSKLRGQIGIVETLLTQKEYSHIQYDKLPSVAGMKYRTAFFRNDEERYKAFLDSLEKGEVKVNSATLYPSDIAGKVLGNGWTLPRLTAQEVQLFEGQWKNLPNFIGEKAENSLVMADVSGSMNGVPMNVSVALAMYIAERNKGVYHNHFMTFSSKPELVKIQGGNIVEKLQNISRADWGMSTNIERALSTILNVAVENNVPQSEMVKKLYIISDMQFDQAARGADVHIFNSLAKEFNRHGYEFPNIVFWNVNAYDNHPMTMNDAGIQLVSGYSPSILTQLLNADGKTPYDFMVEVLMSERYAEVTA
jgi:hypothetical protein